MAILVSDYTTAYNIEIPSVLVKRGVDVADIIDSIGTRRVYLDQFFISPDNENIDPDAPSVLVNRGTDPADIIDSIGTRRVYLGQFSVSYDNENIDPDAPSVLVKRGTDPAVSSGDSEPVVAGKLQQWIG